MDKHRFKQWVWVGQALPKSIILGMFKSDGLEESSKYSCLTTSALINLRSECVSPMGLEPCLSLYWRKWPTLFLPLITHRIITFTPDHGMIPFKNLLTHRKIMFLTTRVLLLLLLLSLLFLQLKIENCIIFF